LTMRSATGRPPRWCGGAAVASWAGRGLSVWTPPSHSHVSDLDVTAVVLFGGVLVVTWYWCYGAVMLLLLLLALPTSSSTPAEWRRGRNPDVNCCTYFATAITVSSISALSILTWL
jgi:hypothetical protein